MHQVYIIDDEEVVRQGLKILVDWHELGFEVCGEAGDGLSALEGIMERNPDLILMDIRMPRMSGLDLARKLRNSGYHGRIIVISGYSDFKYAQEAIRIDVDSYLTKPVDEEELRETVRRVAEELDSEQRSTRSFSYYQKKARTRILEEILIRRDKDSSTPDIQLGELGLEADSYQVLLLCRHDSETDPLQLFWHDMNLSPGEKNTERIQIDGTDVVLLKGYSLIRRFRAFASSCEATKDPAYFIAVGPVVREIREIATSYAAAVEIRDGSFFSLEETFLRTERTNDASHAALPGWSPEQFREMGRQFYERVIVQKQVDCRRYLDGLYPKLVAAGGDPEVLKDSLAGMYIYVVNEFRADYAHIRAPYKSNAEIIRTIREKRCLGQILDYFCEEISEMMLRTRGIGNEGILDEILGYISQHSGENLKLKQIATIFGYNNCYLGRIFFRRFGVDFNDYLHLLRMERAKDLLRQGNKKIYEISTQVGYNKVDYFQSKFKDLVGCTPTEYRMGTPESVVSKSIGKNPKKGEKRP
jgi:two-component system response regulator YesN